MAKMSWNDFVTAYPASEAFTAIVSASLPNGPHFDKNSKKLPTPYGLLQEWLKAKLAGDWTSQTAKGVVMVRIATSQDVATLKARFPAVGAAKKTPIAASTTQISYADADYTKLAIELGYTPK